MRKHGVPEIFNADQGSRAPPIPAANTVRKGVATSISGYSDGVSDYVDY